ncbi:metal ABC transporter ATP-binding protein [Streptomyces sp. ISL-111]|nr:metal ABC transporter ATP-binding protein [Streptomyces sp. ISL-111]
MGSLDTQPSPAPFDEAPEGPERRPPAVDLRRAGLSYGPRVLWQGLDLTVRAGELLAVLGPNGSGKTSLLRVLLGRQQLAEGHVTVLGRRPAQNGRHIGYIPQHTALPAHTMLRSRDLVRLGLDGHRWGIPLGRREKHRRVDELLAAVGADTYSDTPVGILSGGERQRVRIAQAFASEPRLLLCDEPLLSLDLHHQQIVTALVDRRRRTHDTAVVFVTHEINPILEVVDRVLYLAPFGFRLGTPDEVLTGPALSELYGTRIDVIRARGRILVVGVPDAAPSHDHTQEPPRCARS